MLQAQQKALLGGAYGGKKQHKKRIQQQYKSFDDLMGMSTWAGLKKPKKVQKKQKSRKNQIINRINALFR